MGEVIQFPEWTHSRREHTEHRCLVREILDYHSKKQKERTHHCVLVAVPESEVE